MHAKSDIDAFLNKQGWILLDGGLASELEKRGYDLNHRLWSANLLVTNPRAIARVHEDYLAAGADCIISASYQASIQGFITAGQSKKSAINLIRQAVEIACEVRDQFWLSGGKNINGRLKPLVAASVGPYGAALADGSEYRGKYGISREQLIAFHESRWEILSATAADCLACETIPDINEAIVLHRLLEQTPDRAAWISFSCRDNKHISDGTPLSEAVAIFTDCPNVIACGINCTPPRFIPSLIGEVQKGYARANIIVYPNSGEDYSNISRSWQGKADLQDFAGAAYTWLQLGARFIGGCCRTGPQHISDIRKKLTQREI